MGSAATLSRAVRPRLPLLTTLVWLIATGMLLTMLLAYIDEGTWRVYDSFFQYIWSGDIATGDLVIWTCIHVLVGFAVLAVLKKLSTRGHFTLLVLTFLTQVVGYVMCLVLLFAIAGG